MLFLSELIRLPGLIIAKVTNMAGPFQRSLYLMEKMADMHYKVENGFFSLLGLP